jgi:ComEC/Rec2-related protein
LNHLIKFIYFWIILIALLAFRVGEFTLDEQFYKNEVKDKQMHFISGYLLSYPKYTSNNQIIEINGYKFGISKNPDLKLGNYLQAQADYPFSRKRINFNIDLNEIETKNILILNKINNVRNYLINTLSTDLGEPLLSLVLGVTIGYESDFPNKYKEIFRDAGIMHILVVSGYNVNLIINAVGIVLARIGRKAFLLGVPVFITFYLFLVGMQPPVIRASVSGLLIVLTAYLGRPSFPLYSLFLIFIAMIISRPFYILNLSFYLTFLACIGLAFGEYLTDGLEMVLKNRTEGVYKSSFFIKEFIVVLCVNLFISPIFLMAFNYYGTAGLIANIFLQCLVLFTCYSQC